MSTETLERPLPQIQEALIDAQPAAGTDVAVAGGANIDLEKVDIAKLAVATLGNWREKVKQLKADNAKTVLDLTTQTKVDEAISLRNRAINVPKAEANKTTKAVKSALADASKKLGAENELLQVGYDEAATPLTKQIEDAQKVINDKKEAERLAKEKRLAGLRTTVDEIMQKWLDRATAEDITAERIGAGMVMLAGLSMPAEVADVAEHWNTAKTATAAAMTKLQLDKLLAEKAQRDREDADIDKLNELANDCVARGSQYIKDTITEFEQVLLPTISTAQRVLAQAATVRQRMAELLLAAEHKEAEEARLRAVAWELLHSQMDAARDVAAGRAGAAAAQSVHESFITTHGAIAEWTEHTIGQAYVQAMNLLQPQPVVATELKQEAEPTGEGKAGTPGAGNAEAAPRDRLMRDEHGFFLHPDVDWSRVPEEVDATPYLVALGFECSLLTMESDAPALFDQYTEVGEADCSYWTPSRPAGEGWFLGAVWDTEDGPFAVWLRPATKNEGTTEGQHAQQVLKAEPATADATDRATAADASPRVGAMGVEQPADAGPAGEPKAAGTVQNFAQARSDDGGGHMLQDCHRGLSFALASKPDAMLHAREAAAAIEPDDGSIETSEREAVTPRVVLLAEPAEDELHAAARALLAVIAVPLASRFPSQPKVGKEWFDSLYVAAARLQKVL